MDIKDLCFSFESLNLSYHFEITKKMVCKVELIPVSEGNRIIIKENEKIIAGRGSSLGVC